MKTICWHYPDGGGVYASVRYRSEVISIVGAFPLIADYIVTAALSALSAFQYLGWSYPEVFAAGTMLLIGGLNTFGPKHFSGLAFLISVPTGIVVISLGCFVLPHVGEAIRNMQPLHGSWLYNWNGIVSIVLALSGVEAIANATGVMKLNKELRVESVAATFFRCTLESKTPRSIVPAAFCRTKTSLLWYRPFDHDVLLKRLPGLPTPRVGKDGVRSHRPGHFSPSKGNRTMLRKS